MNNCFGGGQISTLYNILLNKSKDFTEHKRDRWINDLQGDVTEGEWTEICSRAHSVRINTHLRLILFPDIQYVSNAIQKKAPYFIVYGIVLIKRLNGSGIKF